MAKKTTDQAWNDWFFNDHPGCGRWLTDLGRAPRTLDAVSVTGKTAGFECLAGMPSLRRLSVRDVSQAQLDVIAKLTRLSELRVFGFHGADAGPLSKLKRLEFLTFEWAPKIETIAWLAGFERLRFLHLGDLKRVRDLAPVGALTSLRYFSISGGSETIQTVASVSPLQRLRKLEELELTARVADEDLSPIAAMTWLKRLSMPNFYPVQVYAELAAHLTGTKCAAFSATQKDSISGGQYVTLTGKPARRFRTGDPKSVTPIAKREVEFSRWLSHFKAGKSS